MRYREGMRLGWLGVAILLAGCGSDSAGADGVQYEDDDFPAGGCRDTDAAGSSGPGCDTEAMPATDSAFTTNGTGTSNTCEGSGDCMGGHCVAPWDAATEMRGEFVCEFACIATLDERRWCSDEGSCCDPAARCTARGYCIVDGEDGSSSSSSGGESGSSSTTDTSTSGSSGS